MVDEYDKQTLSILQWMSDSHTHPGILDYFTTALTHKSLPATVPIGFASDLQQAFADQAKIGWDNLFFGRVADSWRTIQREHLLTTPSRRLAETWTADLVYHLLQFSHSLWVCRNHHVHQRDAQGLLLKDGQTLQESITTFYQQGTRPLLVQDHHLITNRSLQELLQRPVSEKYTWLGAIQQAHKLAKHRRTTEEGQLSADMETFLATGEIHPSSSDDTDLMEEADQP